MSSTAAKPEAETLRTLPGDDIRQILWRFSDRYDLQMLVQSPALGGAHGRRPPGGRRRTQYA